MTAPSPVRIEPVQPRTDCDHVSVATIAFRHAGRLHVTAIAKVALDLVPDGPARLAAAPPICERDALDPRTRVVLEPSDLTPVLGRTDVTFNGHAYAMGRTAVTTMTTRLAIVRPQRAGGPLEGGVTLMDKGLRVVGARVVTRGWPNAKPEAFTSLPVTYALALGGAGDPANPVGIGRPDAQGRTRLPCIENLDPGGVEPAGYGAIASEWPIRAQRLSAPVRAELSARVPSFPAETDFSFFHAAPVDQRVDFLRGDEWIYLEGLHPTLTRLATRLPGIVGRAQVVSEGGATSPLALRADALRIDGDRARCTLVYRGTFALERDADLGRIAVAAGVTFFGQSPAWPAIEFARRASTMLIEMPASASASPSAGAAPADLGPDSDGGRTVILSPESAAQQLARRSGPFPPVVPSTPESDDPPPSVLSSSFERKGTLVLEVEAAPSTRAPFRIASAPVAAAAAPIEGAPWGKPLPRVEAGIGKKSTFKGTGPIFPLRDEVTADASSAVPVAAGARADNSLADPARMNSAAPTPTPTDAKPAVSKVAAQKVSPWRKPDDDAPPPAAAKPAPPQPPKPQKSMYDRFKR